MKVLIWLGTKDGQITVPYILSSHPIKGISGITVDGEPAFITKLEVIPTSRRWRKALAAAVLLAAVAVVLSVCLIGCGAPAARPDSAISQKQLEYLKAANELERAIEDAVEAWEKCVRACKATGNASYICRSLLCPRM